MKQFGEVFLFQTLFMGERKGPPSPTRDHRMLLDALSQRMNQVLREHTEGIYERLESLENESLNWENDQHGDRDRRQFGILFLCFSCQKIDL